MLPQIPFCFSVHVAYSHAPFCCFTSQNGWEGSRTFSNKIMFWGRNFSSKLQSCKTEHYYSVYPHFHCKGFLLFKEVFNLCAVHNISDMMCKDEDQCLVKRSCHVLCPKNRESCNAGSQHRIREAS